LQNLQQFKARGCAKVNALAFINLGGDSGSIPDEILDRFRCDDSVFSLAITESQRILMEEREIFSGIVDAPTEIRARLMKDELERRAQFSLAQANRDSAILVEIKHQINDPAGNAGAKACARHPDYGPMLMLYLDQGSGNWMTVAWDRAGGRNMVDRVFRIELLRSW
jgi:hypothetical protein